MNIIRQKCVDDGSIRDFGFFSSCQLIENYHVLVYKSGQKFYFTNDKKWKQCDVFLRTNLIKIIKDKECAIYDNNFLVVDKKDVI